MSECEGPGRAGNQVIRVIASNIFAEKFNLLVNWNDYHKDLFEKIGLKLFEGTNDFKNKPAITLTSDSYFKYYDCDSIDVNFNTSGFLQSKQVTCLINQYLNLPQNMNQIINNNKFNNRYKTNNDCFIHIRLGDVSEFNPGFEYYDNILSKLKFDNLYVSSDGHGNEIVNKILKKYPNNIICYHNITDTFLFGSTCKHVVLSHGTFSAFIGYISFFSYVYPIPYEKKYMWDWDNNCGISVEKTSTISKWIYL